MIFFHTKSDFLSAALGILLLISSPVYSENSTPSQTDANSQIVALESNHPLAMTHQELKQAHDDFNKGDMNAAQKNLDAASKWLQDAKISDNANTQDEATKLVSEIQALHQQLLTPSNEHEGTLARIWHHSSSLVENEVHQIAKSWSSASTKNETLKHLVDARLHFRFAEHELLISQNSEKTKEALNDTIKALDEADKIANPNIHEKITLLKTDLRALEGSDINPSAQQNIIDALDTASASLQKVTQDTTARIRARLETITTQIADLKNDMGILSLREKYAAIMQRLIELDKDL